MEIESCLHLFMPGMSIYAQPGVIGHTSFVENISRLNGAQLAVRGTIAPGVNFPDVTSVV